MGYNSSDFFVESPIDLAGSPQSLPMSSPQTEEHNSDQVPSTAKTTRTPKRANLISLGFRPISKPSGDTSSTDDGKNSTTTTTRNDPPQQAQVSSENQKKTPKRVNLMNIANFKTGKFWKYFCRLTSFCGKDIRTKVSKEVCQMYLSRAALNDLVSCNDVVGTVIKARVYNYEGSSTVLVLHCGKGLEE